MVDDKPVTIGLERLYQAVMFALVRIARNTLHTPC